MGTSFWLKRAAWTAEMIGEMIVEIVAMVVANAAIHAKTAGRKRGLLAVTRGTANRKALRRAALVAARND
jgi:hypothetical protein